MHIPSGQHCIFAAISVPRLQSAVESIEWLVSSMGLDFIMCFSASHTQCIMLVNL